MSDFKGRPLGGVEKLYLALNEIFVKTFALVAELDGRIPEHRVAPSLDELAKRHPQLNYRIAEDNQFQFWFLNVPESTIPFRIIPVENDHDWTKILADELIKPFDVSKAPLVRIVLLQNEFNSTLIFLSHHSLGDGLAVSFILQDFLRILSGEKLDRLPFPLSMDQLLNKGDGEKHEFIPASSGVRGQITTKDAAPLYIDKLRLSEPLTALLQERARQEQTTVNGALNAAIATAMKRLDERISGRPLITRSPVSARKALDVRNDFVVNVVTKNLDLEPGSHADLWGFARTITSEMAGASSIGPVSGYIRHFREALLQPVALEKIVEGVATRIDTDFMLSNLGRIGEDTFGKYRIQALWGPVVVSGTGAEQTIGTVTIGGQLSMIHISSYPVPALLAAAADILKNALN